jgi:hypothetical protein
MRSPPAGRPAGDGSVGGSCGSVQGFELHGACFVHQAIGILEGTAFRPARRLSHTLFGGGVPQAAEDSTQNDRICPQLQLAALGAITPTQIIQHQAEFVGVLAGKPIRGG